MKLKVEYLYEVTYLESGVLITSNVLADAPQNIIDFFEENFEGQIKQIRSAGIINRLEWTR